VKPRWYSGNRFFAWSLLLIVFIAAGVGIYRAFWNTGSERQTPGSSRPPVTVEILTVTPQVVENTVSAVGTVLANESVTIKPEVAGKISRIGFQEGMLVEQGTTLFTLDAALLEAEYQEVKANYDFASNQYQRSAKLEKDGVIPSEEFDERLRAYLNAKARLNTLATRLQKHTIQAPFRGRVGSRNVSMGDYVAAGEPLVTIDDLTTVKIEFSIPQRFAEKIEPRQPVRVAVEPFPDPFQGSIYLIDPQFDPESRSARVRATIVNVGEVLKPGMFCTVTVMLARRENGLTVPAEAILSRGEQHFLFMDKEGRASMQKVRLGTFTGSSVEIIDGLKPGDRVVTAGMQKLSPGTPLREAEGGGSP